MTAARSWTRLAAPLAAAKLLGALFVAFSTSLLPPIFDFAAYKGNFHWPKDAAPGFASYFSTWDAQHYLYLSRFGYVPGAESDRFFPLWPWLIRAGALVLRDHLVAALLLAHALSLAGFLLFHAWCARRRGEAAADASLLLLLAYPGALFFGFPYSESLFFFLAAAFLLALDLKRWRWVALTAFLLPLTRAVGVVVIAPLLHQAVASRRKNGTVESHWRLCLAAPLLGLAAYFAFMRLAVGDAFFYLGSWSSQDLIGSASLAKLLDLPGFLRAFASVGSFHAPLDSLADRLFFVAFLAACVRLWRTDRAALAFALPLGLIPAVSVSFWGCTRYLVAALPAFLAAGDWFAAKEGRRPWLWLALAGLGAVQVVFVFRHINNYWAG